MWLPLLCQRKAATQQPTQIRQMKTPESGPRTFSAHAAYALAILCLAWLPGCSTSPKKDTGPKHVFYPPAPQPPRLQFLVSFSEENDLGRRQSKLARLV